MDLRRTLLAALLPLTLTAGVEFAFAQPPPGQDAVPAYHIAASEEDVLVLEVQLERQTVSRGILAYRTGEHFLLPLGQLADVLEIAVRVDLPSRRASGWILDESRAFELDLNSARVQFDDHHEGLPDASIYPGYDDIYVRSDLLSRWIPADFEIKYNLMQVVVTPRETLPLTARLDRDRQRARLLGSNQQLGLFPERRARYRPIAWPFVDVTLRGSRSEAAELRELTLQGRGDLANANASGYFRSRTGTVDQNTGWFNLERTDRDRELLGPLRASHVVVGDLFTRNVALVAPGRRGRGVQITNRDLTRGHFDVTDVQGASTAGWEAELYVNGTLRAFQTVDESGRYRFTDVPIQQGTTFMRVVTYGPQGQEREDVQYVTVGNDARNKGRFDYEAYVAQNELSVLGTNLWNRESPEEGAWTHHVQLGYGLTRSLSTEVSIDRVPNGMSSIDLLSWRLNKTVGRMLWRMQVVDNLQRGHLAQLATNTTVRGQNLLLSFTGFDDYVSDLDDNSERDRWRAHSRLTGTHRLLGRIPVGYNLDAGHRQLRGPSLQSNTDVRLRGTAQATGLQFVHEVRVERRRFDDRPDQTLVSGSQLVAGLLGRLRLRGSLIYARENAFGLQALGVGAQRFVGANSNVQADVQRRLTGSKSTRYGLRLNVRRSDLVCGFEFRYVSTGSVEWGVSLSTSFMNKPGTRSWTMSGQRATRSGAAVARTFVDLDGDGAYTDRDEPLEGVAFRRNSKWRDHATDEYGRAWLPGLQPDRPVDIEIDLSSVFDPFLVPRYEGLTTVVHRGGIAELEFPFVFVGDIEGMVFRDLLRNHPMPNVGLELVSPLGERVDTTVTEFDGYYVFQKVPAGAYKIRVIESTLPVDDFVVPSPQPLVVPERGDFVEGPDFVLVREGERLDIRFAQDGSAADFDPRALLGEDASEEIIARVMDMLSSATERPSLTELLGDSDLSDDERRTLEILYELFFESDDRYWLAR